MRFDIMIFDAPGVKRKVAKKVKPKRRKRKKKPAVKPVVQPPVIVPLVYDLDSELINLLCHSHIVLWDDMGRELSHQLTARY